MRKILLLIILTNIGIITNAQVADLPEMLKKRLISIKSAWLGGMMPNLACLSIGALFHSWLGGMGYVEATNIQN